ncbi:hypothetical protein SAFG77S_11857 [Streptomyces afghaniensis]
MPDEPPASGADGSSVLPTSIRTRSSGAPRASAPTCASTVRAPVPMSVALTRTRNVPSGSARADAVAGHTITGYVAAATPVPSSRGPSRREPGRGWRPAHPKRRAPSRRHSTRCLLLNGFPLSGSTSGSLRTRSSTGSMPSSAASSSMADSSAYMPGASPGARIHDGEGTSSATTRCSVRLWGVAYITRAGTAACSTNSSIREVCVVTSCTREVRRPSASAPSRSRVQGGRTMPATAGRYLQGQRHGDGPPGVPRRHRGEHHVGPWRALGAEAAADVLGGDDDPLRGNAEEPGEHALYGTGALAGGVHGEPAVVPAGGAGVRLHRVVVQRRHPVGGIDPGGRGTERPVRVALFADEPDYPPLASSGTYTPGYEAVRATSCSSAA